jgi:hypothetical protein
MHRPLLVILVAWCAAATAPYAAIAALARAQHAPKLPKLLYHDDFKSKGLKGWNRRQGGTGWRVTKKGVVTFDASGSGEIQAPFSTAKYHDFRVQVSIKDAPTAGAQTSGAFGLDVGASAQAFGVGGGYFFSLDPSLSQPLLLWGDQSAGGDNLSLTSGFNTFQMDVHGTDFTFSIDGRQMVQFPVGDAGPGNKIGIWTERAVQIKSFTVTQLSKAAALPSAAQVKTINLGSPDVPALLQSEGGHFYTNAEFARLAGVPIDTVASEGRLLTHETDFLAPHAPASGAYGIASDVAAFSSAGAAQQDMAGFWSALQKQFSGNSNYVNGDLAGVGDQAHILSYDQTETGYASGNFNATFIWILLTRGSYEVAISEDFVAGTLSGADMTSAATALVKIIDQRIMAAHIT